MLGSQHLLCTYRSGKAYPKRLTLTAENLEMAEALLYCFRLNEGQTRAELEEELKQLPGGNHPKLVAGLSKLLMDQSEFSQLTASDQSQIREKIFDHSTSYWQQKWKQNDPTRTPTEHQEQILADFTDYQEANPESVEGWLFGDLKSNQKLTKPPSLSATELIESYNLAQVQALLLNAKGVEVALSSLEGPAARQMMGMMKFFGLLFEIQPSNENSSSVTLVIAGPQSILEHGRSYGIELANFFPAILLLQDKWSFTAFITRKGVLREFTFELSQSDLKKKTPYRNPYQLKGQWWQTKLEELAGQFNEKYSPTCKAVSKQTIISLSKNRYLISDLELKQGRKKVQIEWVRYLTAEKIIQLKKIAKEIPKGYYLLIKAKGLKKQELTEILGKHLIAYGSEPTPFALRKAID